MKKQFSLLLPLCLLLCSFTNGNTATVDDYHTSSPKQPSSIGNAEVGKEIKFDVPKSGVIGRYVKLTINSISTYQKSSNNAYIYSFGDFFEKNAVSNLQFETSYSYSETYTYAYSMSIMREISNGLSAKVSLADFAEASADSTLTKSIQIEKTFSYTYGTVKSTSVRMDVNLNTVPDKYEFAVGIICDATIIKFKYTVYDQYWWGDFESKDSTLVNQKNDLFIYSKLSMCHTLVIRPHTSSSRPTLYL